MTPSGDSRSNNVQDTKNQSASLSIIPSTTLRTMKLAQGPVGIAIVSLFHFTSAEDPCIEGGFSIEFDGNCAYKNDNMVSALQELLNVVSCQHTFGEKICLQLELDVYSTKDDVHKAVRSVCTPSW